jgi:hypothetical protein
MEIGGSSFAHDNYVHEVEEEYAEVDEEGEGMVGAPTGRKINYTVDEDVLLCKTWLKIGMDPSIGTDQTRDTYWIRMKEYFDANTRGVDRTSRSLRSRWSVINQDCSRWASAQKTVDDINPSGTNDSDRVSCSILFICAYLLCSYVHIYFVHMCISILFICAYLFCSYVHIYFVHMCISIFSLLIYST